MGTTDGATPVLTIAERIGDLVRIPSVNPGQAGPKSGDDGERAISSWLADQADALGAEVTVDDILDGRSNVYARFEGETERVVTVDVHLDTVGVEHMTEDPFDGRIENDRVYGRGSVDTKASLALVLTVLGELKAEGRRPRPTVNVVGTISEEMGGLIGASGYRDWLQANGDSIDQLVVAEPTNCAPVHGHKGGLGLEVTVHGHAAHSSKPHLGQNAISAAARIICAVDAEQERLQQAEATTAVGNGTVSVNEVEGGLARNIIPDCCTLYTGRRMAPGEDPDQTFAQLSDLIRGAAAPLEVAIELANGFGSAAFYQDPTCELIAGLARLADAAPDVASYGSNALRYAEVASEIVVFGPGSIDQAHQAVEWIDLSEIQRATDIYRSWLRS
ncbi:MAG: acetylornithine deacetylase/succinyl-diaminopimelate desuccinylase-like protein [Acidimicrobiales bacterium]|jgi:acetylornithine deacetylase/succinyl-diaminopimelate desuccinylase-like protein